MISKVFLILSIIGVVFGSPVHEQFIERIDVKATPTEDALADVPEIIAKTGYPSEKYTVETEDGYLLQVHRIPHGKSGSTGKRPVVFLMHGLLSSSADWVISGPGSALAYVLVDKGYDVWMGNARGNYYSRNHTTLDPDSDTLFWKFSWHEMGVYDVPAMIDLALKVSGNEKLHFIAHSQGVTVFLVMAASKEEYRNKIISMNAMAPAVYTSNSEGSITEVLNKYGLLDIVATLIGPMEVLPRSLFLANIAHTYCGQYNPLSLVCTKILSEMVGASDQYNRKLLPTMLSHTPAGSSTRQFIHFSQLHTSGIFQQFDYGSVRNMIVYGTSTPPKYDLSLVDVPVTIWYGATDTTINSIDLDRLLGELGNGISVNRVEADLFNHLDFVWGTKANIYVYNPIIESMQKYE